MSERLEQDEEADGAEITDNLTLLEKHLPERGLALQWPGNCASSAGKHTTVRANHQYGALYHAVSNFHASCCYENRETVANSTYSRENDLELRQFVYHIVRPSCAPAPETCWAGQGASVLIV